MRGADLLAAGLRQAGVRHLPTLSGNQIMPLYTPLEDAGISVLHMRHEAAAVHAADAYARLTEQPGVVLVTAGPGHANTLGALYTARMAESPLVMLSGHAESDALGRGAFQEMDQAALARPVVKAAWTVHDAARLGDELARAFRAASSGRPGPVSLSLPADLLRNDVAVDPPRTAAFVPRVRHPSDADVDALLELLSTAARPLILAGPDLSRGRRWGALLSLAQALGVPALPMESPRGANDPTLGGTRALFPQADLVLLLGRRLDSGLGYGAPPLFGAAASFVRVDADPDLPRAPRPLLDVRADPAAVVDRLAAAIGLAPPRSGRGAGRRRPGARRSAPVLGRLEGGWADAIAGARTLGREDWGELERSDQSPMHPLRLARAAGALLGPQGVLVSDGGEVGQWAQAGASADSRVINGPSGAIGGALPFAIGAALARPGAPIVAFSGDGAIGYHLAELDTAARARMRFVVIVGNDQRWNAEVVIQRSLGLPPLTSLELTGTRYDGAAVALGCHGERVDDPALLEPALRRAAAAPGPALVDVAIAPVPAPTYRPSR